MAEYPRQPREPSPKLIAFMDQFEREMAGIREQNYYLNRQFNDNLIMMKQQARKLNNQRAKVENELAMLRRIGLQGVRGSIKTSMDEHSAIRSS